MRNQKKVENNIYAFVGEIEGASAALSLLWEYCDAEPTSKRMAATSFLIDEIYNRLSTLDDFLADSGDLSSIFTVYKSKLDIYKMLDGKRKNNKSEG